MDDENEEYRFNSDRKEDGERRARMARMSLMINIVLAAVSIIGASTFWILLPARIQQVVEKSADHETRLRSLESMSGEHSATLGRIDERTKSIQESVADIRSRIQTRP